MRTILFVCTGNTCRSPMAEAIARHVIDRGLLGDDPDVFVASAGVGAAEGAPTTEEAVAALRSLGVEFSGRSKPLTGDMVRKADIVLAMTSSHVERARALAGDGATIQRLDPGRDIEDPLGMEQGAYDELAERLMELIPRRIKEAMQE